MAGNVSPDKLYHGVIVPMVTPLNAEGELDEPALRRIVDYLVTGGIQGIFVLGTIGEGPSLPREIRSRLVHLAVEYADNRIQVYAGIASTIVGESIEAAREFLRRGAVAVVATLPSYYTLTGDEQFHYFATLAKRIRGPILLYDIPASVHMAIDPAVIEHLRAFPNVVGIKDSSGDPDHLAALIDTYSDDPGFSVLVGTTALASYGMRRGADGFVPSAGNLNPALCARLYTSAQTGDWTLMDNLQREVDALQAEFAVDGYIGRSIARLKRLMNQRGLCGAAVSPPLEAEE